MGQIVALPVAACVPVNNAVRPSCRWQALAKESEKLATVMAHQQQTSATGQPAGSPQAAAAVQQTAGGGGQDVQVRLSRLEALVQQLVERQAAREDARLEQEALQRQQSAAAPETAARSSAVGQQAGQQQLQAAVERQPEQPVAESPHAVQHPAEQPAQDVQQGPRSLLQRVQPAWGWVRGRLAGAAAEVASPPAASSQAGSRAEAGQPGHGDGKSASSVQGSALQKEDGGVSEGGGLAQAASGMPLALPAAARAPGGGTRGAAEAQAAHGPALPATAAQWLLHSVGAPLRWLRQRDAGPPS